MQQPEIPKRVQIRHPSYWSHRYETDDIPWDLGAETAVFRALRADGEVPVPAFDAASKRPSRVWVPGCGSGYDVLGIARDGYHSVGVDFSSTAIDRLQALAAQKGLEIEPIVADIFDLAGRFRAGWFDLAVDYTCYCAIPPERRVEYAQLLADSLRPGGFAICLAFPIEARPSGPPFEVRPAEMTHEFESVGFACVSRRRHPKSHSKRASREELLVFRREESAAG